MAFNFPAFSIAFFVGGILCLVFSHVTWSRRPSPGALPFALSMLAMSVWLFSRALEAGAVEINDKIIWGNVEYFGVAFVGSLWLSFASDYTGLSWWRRPRNLALLMLFPAVSLVMVWTNHLHGWVWPIISPSPGTSGTILIWQHGWWFWLLTAYNYVTITAGIVILWKYIFVKPGPRRTQITLLFLGTLIPLVGNIVYLSGYSPVRGLDLTPFGFVFAATIYGVTIFRYRLMQIVPLARGALVESLPEGIIVIDGDGCLIDMNRSAEKIIGANLVESNGRPIEQLIPQLSNLIRSEDARQSQSEVVINQSENRGCYELNITNLRGRNMSSVGKLVVFTDISERKATQKKLEKLYQEELRLRSSLQEEIEKRSKYTRSLVHELKTPLTAILASSELLEEEVHDKLLSALVQNIRRASSNLEQRINELIELARGEIGLLHIDAEPVDMAKLVDEIVSEMSPVAENKNLRLIYVAEDTLPQVFGDKSRLRQVLTNLVSNAVKFTPRGSITIKTTLCDEGVLVQVADTGRGIEEKEMQQLFDPYRPRDFDRSRLGGLGIGLALSKIIVDLHHGKIWAESKQGEGSTFSFTIPVVDSAIEQADKPEPRSAM